MTKLFIIDRINPWMPVKEMDVELFVGKRVWIKVDGVCRYLVGSTAFFTEAAANVARVGYAVKIVQRAWTRDGQIWRYVKSKQFIEESGIQLKENENGKSRRNKA